MKKTGWSLLLLSVLFGTQTSAMLEYNDRVARAYRHIIRLELDSGQNLLQEERRINPSNNLVLLYENYADFLKAFIS